MSHDEYLNALKAWMHHHDISQSEAARRLSAADDGEPLRPNTISRWLSGQRNIGRNQYERIETVCRQFFVDDRTPIIGRGTRDTKGEDGWTEDERAAWHEEHPDLIRNTPTLVAWILGTLHDREQTLRDIWRKIGYDKIQVFNDLLHGRRYQNWWRPDRLKALIVRGLELPLSEAPIDEYERHLLASATLDSPLLKRTIPVVSMAMAQESPNLSALLDSATPEWWDNDAPTDGREYVGFFVSGDSMKPHIRDGDYVRCCTTIEPCNEEDVVALYHDEQGHPHCVVKQFEQHGSVVLLRSANTSFPDVVTSPTSLQWCYPVVGIFRKRHLTFITDGRIHDA